MSTICLYDIDYLHGSKFIPNLELMKVYHYYYNRNDIVNLAEKGENLERYNQVFFFKQSPKIKIPKNLSLSGEKNQILGYGFYKKNTPLKPEIQKLPPMFLPYDLSIPKKYLYTYEKIKKNAIIRVENNDFTDIKDTTKEVFIADFEPLKVSNMFDFLKNNKLYKVNFLFPIEVNTIEDFYKYYPYTAESNRLLIINFPFNSKFFKEYFDKAIQFKIPNEDYKTYFIEKISLILYSKTKGKQVNFFPHNFTKTEIKKEPLKLLEKSIDKWNYDKTQKSYYEFIKDSKDNNKIKMILESYDEPRVLLKQKPSSLQYCDVNF